MTPIAGLHINEEGDALIRDFEKCRLEAYQDSVGVWTIGWGRAIGVKAGDVCTQDQADSWYRDEVNRVYLEVSAMAGPESNENQLAAMTCFAYNVGVEGLRGSTVLKKHVEGDFQAASRAFNLWNKAGGRVSNGLTRRRAAEQALYLKPTFEISRSTPAADRESPARSWGIAQAGGVGGISGGLALVQQTNDALDDAKHTLGSWVVPALLVVVIVACALAVLWRFKQREGGWT